VWWNTPTAQCSPETDGLIDDPARFDGVTAMGVDEDMWTRTYGATRAAATAT